MSILIVGSVALDDIETPYGEHKGIQGGSASHASCVSSYFAPTNIVGIVGSDFPKKYINFFKRRGIGLDGLEIIKGGRTFHWSGYYDPSDLNIAHSRSTCLNVFENFSPKIPSSCRNPRFLLLGNILPELQLQVLDQVKKPELTLLDTMNFWIQGRREALLKVFKRVDLVCLNDGEVRMLCDEPNLIKAGGQVLKMGPKFVIIKKGEHGAVLISKTDIFAAPAWPLKSVKDPTGAGDCFAGGFLGYLAQRRKIDNKALRQAVMVGTVMASFCCEGFGVTRIARLRADHIKKRLADLQEMADCGRIRVTIR